MPKIIENLETRLIEEAKKQIEEAGYGAMTIRKQTLESVRYAADRADDKVKFTDDALEMILNVPRVFLPLVLKGCVDWARENDCQLIIAREMQIINDKRAKEKNKK